MADKALFKRLIGFGVVIILVLGLLIYGIIVFSSASKKETFCEDIEDKFQVINPSDLLIFIDKSESMKGFVRQEGSIYSIFVRRHLPSIVGTIPNHRIFGFGRTREEVSISQIAIENFYTDSNTLFASVLEEINNQQPNRFLIVSDLVISAGREEGNERLNFIRELSALSQKGYNFELIGIQSSFSGPAFSESYGRGLYIGTYTGLRPFYLLFGYKKGFDLQGLRNLQIQGADMRRMPFNVDEPSTLGIDLQGSAFILKNRKTVENKDKCLVVRWDSPNSVGSEIRAIVDPNLRIVGISSKIIPAPTQQQVSINMSEKPRSNSVRIRIPNFVSREKYTYCKIDIFTRRHNNRIAIPSWITEWSTGNDTGLENYNRTFGLEDLVQRMLNAIEKPESFYLVIEN